MLERENESIKYLYFNRIYRIVRSLVIFSAIYYIREVWSGNQALDISDFLYQLYDSDWNFSYWYLYAFVAYLMTLPLLRTLAKNLDNKWYYYMFALSIIFMAILPILQYLFWQDMHNLNVHLRVSWISVNIVIYPLLGYFLQHRIHNLEKRGNLILSLWIVNIIAIMICCYMTYLKAINTGVCTEGQSQTFHNSLVIVNTTTIFLTTKYLFLKYEKKLPKWFCKYITSFGSCTFGIYLWHIMFLSKLEPFQKLWCKLRENYNLNHMIATFLVCFCVMIVGFVVTKIMKKLPFIKELV